MTNENVPQIITDIIAMYPNPKDLPNELQVNALLDLYNMCPEALIRMRLALVVYKQQTDG